MTETWLKVGPTQSAVKVVFKRINVWRGVGVARFMFTFEVNSKQQAVVGCPLWLGGRVEVLERHGHVRPYLATFQPQAQPVTLPQLGVDQTVQLTLDVTDRQLHLIEGHRVTGGLHLDIYLSGHAIQDGQYVPVSESQINHEISQSDWIALLEQAGYRRFLLLELEVPDTQTKPDLAEAVEYYAQAQRHYLGGEWRLIVESLRQSLASLVGKKADEEDQETDVAESLKALRKGSWNGQVGYQPRLEHVRQAAKFLCDLGAHPEADETLRRHAYAALLIVAGLLHAGSGSSSGSA